MGLSTGNDNDDRINIWIKSELILLARQSGLSSLERLKSKRSVNNFDEGGESESGAIDWGWVRGFLKGDPLDDKTEADDSLVEIEIFDTESAFNGQTFSITQKDAKAGTVLANAWEHKDDDDDNFGGNMYDSSESDDENDNSSVEWRVQNKPPVDLVNLTHLHEPAVVNALRKRYAEDEIYTATGPILLALNPFKYCENLYSKETMKAYWEQGEQSLIKDGDKKLPPHVYFTADHTFRLMLQSVKTDKSGGSRSRGSKASSTEKTDQSILVSGESGAGKTVTTKYIMKYLATLSQRSDHSAKTDALDDGTEKKNIEQQVLQSNPILESFGNARTIRNDNSSRFGKFIELQFSNNGALLGACIETYLLEKVRLINQAEGERNYHVFYELLDGMEDDELSHFFLEDLRPEDFRITSMSGTYDRRDDVHDFDTYSECKEAMDIMGFSKEEQREIYEVTCACLHSSNLELIEITADECKLDRDNQHLDAVVSLLGVDMNNLNEALCYFNIVAGKEKHRRSLPKFKVEKGIEALIKATYGSLFNYLVKKINESITVDGGAANGRRKGARGPTKASSIGVLDIFGFESFQVNSFEQLCINYCNEALQLQFNLFVLKNEQEEYTREGIRWSFIAFPENQDVLDLIDKKGTGIIYVLDDQCKAPGTTDKTFASSLYKKCKNHTRFECDSRQVGANLFGIRHYAGLVEYQTEGFMEKNRDELPREAQDLLMSSSKKFVRHLAEMLGASDDSKGRKSLRASTRNQRQTVGGQFCSQLLSLRQKIDKTSPHYVRCLKPNSMLVPDNFNPILIADQLRCNGVIEAIRVSRLGYPQRYAHKMFLSRYRAIAAKELQLATKKSRKTIPVSVLVKYAVKKIAETSPECQNMDSNKIDDLSFAVGVQLGKTKVFLRRHAFDALEKLRSKKLTESAIYIQKYVRLFVARKSYKRVLKSTILIQSMVRQLIAKKVVHTKRRNYKATVIQSKWRRYYALSVFLNTKKLALNVQRIRRGILGRQKFDRLNRIRKATFIQKCWRKYMHHTRYKRIRKATVVIQCALRSKAAREQFTQKRKAAKDMQNVANERDELKRQAVELRRKLYEKAQSEDKKMAMKLQKLMDENKTLSISLNEASVTNKKLLAEANEKKDLSKTEMMKLKKENEEMSIIIQTNLAQATADLATKTTELNIISTELTAKSAELADEKSQNKILSSQLEEEKSTNKTIIEGLQQDKQDLENELDEMAMKEESLQKASDEYQDEIDRLQEENRQIITLELEIQGVREELVQKDTELSETITQQNELKEKKSQLEEQLDSKAKDLEEKELRLAATIEEKGAIQEDVLKLQAELKGVEASRNETKESLQLTLIELKSLESEVSVLRRDVSSKKELEDEYISLRIGLAEKERLEKEIVTLKQDADAKIEDLKEDKSMLKQQLEAKERDCTAKDEELSKKSLSLENEINSALLLKERCEKLERELVDLKESIEVEKVEMVGASALLSDEISSLRDDLEKEKKANKEFQSSLNEMENQSISQEIRVKNDLDETSNKLNEEVERLKLKEEEAASLSLEVDDLRSKLRIKENEMRNISSTLEKEIVEKNHLKRENEILNDVNEAMTLKREFHEEQKKRRDFDMNEIEKLKNDCHSLHKLQNENKKMNHEILLLRQESEDKIKLEEENIILRRQISDREYEKEITEKELLMQYDEEIQNLKESLMEKEETEEINRKIQNQLEDKLLVVTHAITQSRKEILNNGEELAQLRSENFSLWQELDKTRENSSQSVAKNEKMQRELRQLDMLRNENEALRESEASCKYELDILIEKSGKMRAELDELEGLRDEVTELKGHLDSTVDALEIQNEEIDLQKKKIKQLKNELDREKRNNKALFDDVDKRKMIKYTSASPQSSQSRKSSEKDLPEFNLRRSGESEEKEKQLNSQIHMLWEEIERLKEEKKSTPSIGRMQHSQSLNMDTPVFGRRRSVEDKAFSSTVSARDLIKNAEEVGRSMTTPSLKGRTVVFNKKHSFSFDDDFSAMDLDTRY